MTSVTNNSVLVDDEMTLEEVNARRVQQLVPIMVYMGVLSFVGATGNGFVIYLFITKFKKATSARFIVWLGILDFVMSAVGMPFEIVDITLSYTFTNPVPCVVFRFCMSSIVHCSALTLIVVALDRFIKVCYPLKGWKFKTTRTLSVTNLVGVVIAIPVCFVYGIRQTPTIEKGVNGTECSVSDDMHDAIWPAVYYAGVSIVFAISFISLAVLYGRLVYTLFKRKREMRKDSLCYDPGVQLRVTTPGSPDSGVASQQTVSADDGDPKASSTNDKILQRKKTRRKIRRIRRNSNVTNYPGYFNIPTERTSVIFACVSVGFVMSYLPTLIILITRESDKHIEEQYFHSTRTSDISYNLFLRSYFLNHVINPIIYGFLNPSFRRACLRILCPCAKFPDIEVIDQPIDSSSSLQSNNAQYNVAAAVQGGNTSPRSL